MQDILNSIDSIPEDTENVIKSIYTFDASVLSVTYIRNCIEYINKELKKNITNVQNDCYYKLLVKLTIERGNRPFHEQFPDFSTKIDKMDKIMTLISDINTINSNRISNLRKNR